MFWGLIMEPHRRYTQKVKKAFHISMAALDLSTSSDEPAQVMCGFEGRNYLLCTLKKPDVLQCPLDLMFDAGSEVSFAANGRCHIHLTGYLTDDFTDIEEEEVIEEESMDALPKANKRNAKKTADDAPPSKKSKNGVVTSSQDQDEEEEDSDDSDYLENLLGKSLEDDEDDSDESGDEEEDEEGEEVEEEEEELDEEEESSLSEADVEEEEEDAKAPPKLNGLLTKAQKKREKKKNKEKQQAEEAKKTPQQQKKEAKTPQQQQKKDGKTPNKENQTPRRRSLQGGVIVEDLKEGDGFPAKNGRLVTVYYEGRLKQNNKLFDSAQKGSGFSFRLGHGDVIRGWDVGVAGMKIGGKRRITCPPAMAYGQKGSPPAIPPNSTLVFDVELRNVQ